MTRSELHLKRLFVQIQDRTRDVAQAYLALLHFAEGSDYDILTIKLFFNLGMCIIFLDIMLCLKIDCDIT